MSFCELVPFDSQKVRAPAARAGGVLAPRPPCRCALMANRRTMTATAWQAKVTAAGVSLSALLRQAMALRRSWTASVVEREHTR